MPTLMDWELAIKRNLGALLRLLGVMLGRVHGSVSRRVHLDVLRRVRAVEAGVRRLIVVAAREVVVVAVPRGAPDWAAFGAGGERGRGFALLDPRKEFGLGRKVARVGPQVTVVGVDDWQVRTVPPVGAALNLERLRARLLAVEAALGDLPKQARRLVRWRMRRDGAKTGPLSPMRPGWPPGYRVERQEPMHRVLLELDTLARRVENAGV